MSDNEQRFRKALLLAWRGMLSFGVVALFAATGVLLGIFLVRHAKIDDAALRLAAATLGVSSLLLMIREGLSALPQLLSYVRTGAGENLYKFAAYALVSSASVSVALGLNFPTDRAADSRTAALPQVFFLQGGRVPQSGQSVPTFLVPFGEEAEVCAADASCVIGISLDSTSMTYIQMLGQGLSSCGTTLAPVEVSVRGFASSSRFPGRADSDDLNRQVANQRAGVVAATLRNALSVPAREDVRITTVTWPTYSEMTQVAGFNDVDGDGQYSADRGLLNRRAEIAVDRSGECEVAFSGTPQ